MVQDIISIYSPTLNITAQSGRGEHLTPPSHITHHAVPQQAVHEDAQTTLIASGISLNFHPKLPNQ